MPNPTRSLAQRLAARVSPLARVVLAVNVLGVLAVGLVAWVGAGRSAPMTGLVPGLPERWLLPLLFLLTIAGELTAVRLRHGSAVEELTLFEAAVVVDVLVLPPWQAVLVPLAALAVASALVRRQPIKAVFNLGSYAASTAVLVLTVAAVNAASAGSSGTVTSNAVARGVSGGFDARTTAAVVLGTIGFAAVNLLCLSRVLSVASRMPAGETLREGWRISAVMAIGTAAIGTVLVAIARTSPVLLPFTLLPAGALTYAYRAVAQEAEERDRSGRLLALSHVLAGRRPPDELIEYFLALARGAFRADSAALILLGNNGQPVTVLATAQGLGSRAATEDDLAVLAGLEQEAGTGLVKHDTGIRLVSPLEADGVRLGALCIHAEASRLTPADAALLAPLASALAAALRSAQHLERLVEESGKLHAVVEFATDGILVLDGAGEVLVWNPAMATITGIGSSVAVGSRFAGLLPTIAADGSPTDAVALAMSALSPAQPQATVEFALQRPDGERRWVRAAHAALFEGVGEAAVLVRDVVLVHDVTRERQVDRLKADFIATVSHELRTPVTPIKGYTDLLRRRGETFTPEKRKECLDIIADRVAHLARLVEDLLLASRVASPASAVQLGTGELTALVGKAVGDFTVDAARITVDVPASPVLVVCDPVRVVQVLSNLLSNSLKYSAEGSPVAIAVQVCPGGMITTTVTDEGRGIPVDQLEAVFDKFHRVEDPMLMTTGGTGLGLYISRQLAEAMGGTLNVSSTLGVGSTFTLRLSAAVPGAALIESRNSMPAPRRPPFPVLPRAGN